MQNTEEAAWEAFYITALETHMPDSFGEAGSSMPYEAIA